MDNEDLKKCVAYFKERPVYEKLFDGFRKKYASLGHFGGKVILSTLTATEKSDLGGFLQKDFSGLDEVSISATLLEKALKASRFSYLEWPEIFENYFGEPLLVKSLVKKKDEQLRDDFFEDFLNKSPEGRGKTWLKDVLKSHEAGFTLLMSGYRENKDELSKELKYVLSAIDLLSTFTGERRELLPVFSSLVTGDPHYFDEGRAAEKLLFSYISVNFDKEGSLKIDEASGTEYKNRLYYEAGILRDDLSNDVLVYGIRAWKKDGSLHMGIEGFLQEKEPVKLTLHTIGLLKSAKKGGFPLDQHNKAEIWHNATDDSLSAPKVDNHKIYVVENPAVFAKLINKFPGGTFILGNGQPRLALLALMDLLSANSSFFYMGDYDPEGLLIAQRLKERYKDRLKLWNYKAEWFLSHCSQNKLSPPRLKKLERIYLSDLQELVHCMRQKERAAYQESMVNSILESLLTQRRACARISEESDAESFYK